MTSHCWLHDMDIEYSGPTCPLCDLEEQGATQEPSATNSQKQ